MSFRSKDQLLFSWSPDRTISTGRSADILDVSKMTVTRLIKDGTLKAHKVHNKLNSPWQINYESLEAHIERMYSRNGLKKRPGDEVV
jgi:excisionase family DNA binding protein